MRAPLVRTNPTLINARSSAAQARRAHAGYYDVSEVEFVRTLQQRLGYTGPIEAARGVFALLGGDDGKISVDELFEFATGRGNAMALKVRTQSPLTRTRAYTQAHPAPASACERV